MKGKSQPVTFKISGSENKYQLKGTVAESDIVKLGLGESFQQIHEACKELHTGASDGKSVTWREVRWTIEVSVVKKCSYALRSMAETI